MEGVGYHCLNTVFMVTPRAGSGLSPSYLLGVLNSAVIRSLWLGRFYDQRTTFPKIKGSYLKELPIPLLDLAIPGECARHDALVALVEKMLALVPSLRAARGEAERATLQNAVLATDQQIDAAVHALFGLGPEDAAVVEAGARAG